MVVEATAEAIAAGLRAMAALDRDTLLTMGQRAHHLAVSQFSWNRTASTLLEAYRNGHRLDRR
jgi:glycosyltransferase involved in cell wall biosynthesis